MLLAEALILLRLRGGLLARLARARGGLSGLLWQQNGLDVGQNASLGDGHAAEQLVQLLVVPHSQLEVAGDDAGLLVVSGGVASQLQDLGGQILQDGGQVHGGPGTDSLCVITFAEETVDATDGKLQARAGAAGLGLGAGLSSGFASSRHLQISRLPTSRFTAATGNREEKTPRPGYKSTASPASQADWLAATEPAALIGCFFPSLVVIGQHAQRRARRANRRGSLQLGAFRAYSNKVEQRKAWPFRFYTYMFLSI